MDKTLAHRMARTLMDDHGLTNIPFEWSRGKRTMGTTVFKAGEVVKITLSHIYTDLLTEAEVKDTVLHEIAHALVGIEAGHGYMWKAKCREIGARPNACNTTSASPPKEWSSRCANGHEGHGQHRAPLRVRSCAQCFSGWNPDYIMTWYKSGKPVPVHAMPVRYRNEVAALIGRGVI